MTDKDNVDYESGFGTELKPSGFSVVTDSIARSRFEHFKRETSVDKLPSISKTSDDTSDEVETESDDEILFSGLSYVKFPDIQGGVGQPSKEQKYVKKMMRTLKTMFESHGFPSQNKMVVGSFFFQTVTIFF